MLFCCGLITGLDGLACWKGWMGCAFFRPLALNTRLLAPCACSNSTRANFVQTKTCLSKFNQVACMQASQALFSCG